MPEFFYCPYFGVHVEVTDERYRHVLARHSDFASLHWGKAAETLLDPDLIWTSRNDKNDTWFYRWYDELDNYVKVAVISDPNGRRRLATAFITGKIRGGSLLWERS